MGRYIKIDENNKVIQIRYGNEIVEGEIESLIGELGQIMQPDGTFITPVVESVKQTLTLEEQIEQLKQDNLILMDALASIYEEILNMQGGVV